MTTTATLTETKLRDMTPGQTVTFPTTYGGTHTGVLVRFDARGPLAGPDAVVAVYRDSEGETVRVQTGLNYTGWVKRETTAAERLTAAENRYDAMCRDESADAAEILNVTDALHDAQAAAERAEQPENLYPALYGETVTAEHTALCKREGHVEMSLQGADPDYCVRCGAFIADAADEQPDDESNDVRVITDGGELVSYTEHGSDSEYAWTSFAETVHELQDGEIAQLIVDDLIAAEHNPEYHGTAPLDVTDYA